MHTVTERYSENIAKNVQFTGIYGTITLKSGEVYEFTDKDIKEHSLSISSKMNSSGEFKAGGVFASELSVTLMDFGDKAYDLAGAVIQLEFRLYTDSTCSECDAVPLGIFHVDGPTIKRKVSAVSFKALDRLAFFANVSTSAVTGSLYQLVVQACTACGVAFGMTEEDFSALPNSNITASINTARIQKWSDLLMYVGVVTCSFARMSRSGELEFVPLTCTKNEGGVIVPVREIRGDVRGSTEFSDCTQRVTKFIMNRGGVCIAPSITVTGSSSEYLTLEWAENPLLSAYNDEKVQEMLNAAVTAVYQCLNRAYKSTLLSGDPALDIGDYVRLWGGDIDTSRGYGTGMITMQTWKYRGNHTIQCRTPSSVSGDGSAAQSKSQTDKRLDAIEAELAGGSSPATPPLTSYSILSDSSVQCNGRRYDIETDSTGLISRITDDLGGVLVPENVAAPADLALHNAVLWAVAISKGLASPQPSGEYVYICTDYDAEKKLWTNQSGAPPLDLSAALINSDGIHGNVWWTVPVIPNPLGQFTFYAVARAADFDNLTGNWMNVIANEGATPQYNLTVRHKKWSIGTDEDTGYHWGDTYATEWRVLAVRRNGAVGEFYVDDSLQHSLSYCHPQIGDVDENFQINGVDFKFRYIGIFNEYHDDATLKAKIAELQQTYYTELPAVNDWKLLQSSSSGSYKTSETLSGAIPHSETGYAMLVVSTRYELSLSDDSWELLTQSAVTNEGVAGLAKQSFFVYIKPLSEFDGSDYSVTVSATRFIWASLSYFTDAAKISVAHTSALSAQSWVTPAKTEPTKRLYLVTVTHEVTPSLQSAVDGTSISYIARTNTTRALMAYDYKPDMMSPLNIDTADSTSGQDCRAVLVLDIE